MRQVSRRPRLAVSGASGTGKTTLARALAGSLGVPYLEEGMRRRLEGGLDLHTLSHAEHRSLSQGLLEEMLAAMAAARTSHGGHVCDRSPLDMIAFWIYYNFVFDEAATDAFMRQARASLVDLDLVVLLPRDCFALEDDGVRSANPWVQFHFDAVLQAVVEDVGAAVRILRLPRDCVEPASRVAAVLDAL